MSAKHEIENLTPVEIRARVEAAMSEDFNAIAVFERVAFVMAEHGYLPNEGRGKAITRRLQTLLTKSFENEYGRERAVVFYDDAHGMLNLRIWGVPGAEKYDNRVSIFLGYSSDRNGDRCWKTGLTREAFDAMNGCIGAAAKARIEKATAWLASDSAEKLAECRAEALAALERASAFECPVY